MKRNEPPKLEFAQLDGKSMDGYRLLDVGGGIKTAAQVKLMGQIEHHFLNRLLALQQQLQLEYGPLLQAAADSGPVLNKDEMWGAVNEADKEADELVPLKEGTERLFYT